jgi:hypothetical protein
MLQTKISLEEAQMVFLSRHGQLGFRDRSALVRAALDRMRIDLERQRLDASATLYAEEYGDDPDLRELTEAALAGWPE